jgi:ribonuclease P protein subunit RPR2
LRDKKEQVKEVARERIEILVKNALREKDIKLAGRQAALAKKMVMRHRVRMPYEARQLFCKKCKAFIVPGRTARVRVGRAGAKAVRITCALCGHTYRKILKARGPGLRP